MGGTGNQMPVGWPSGYSLFINGSNEMGIQSGALDLFGVDISGDSLNGSWHHVAVVLTNNAGSQEENQLYIDAELRSSSLLQGSFTHSTVGTQFFMGGRDTTSSYKFSGDLDEVRVYDRGLSASEIYQDMESAHSCD